MCLRHEAAGSISTPSGWDASPSRVNPPQFVRFPQQFADTKLYSWVERDTDVSVLSKNTTQCPQPGFDPGTSAP